VLVLLVVIFYLLMRYVERIAMKKHWTKYPVTKSSRPIGTLVKNPVKLSEM
jgi:hypothetical protein